MELVGKQRRLLNDLADIDEYGGRLEARLEQGDDADFYRLEGSKGTQSDPMDLTYTIGAAYLDELRENALIGLDLTGEGKFGLRITPEGSSSLGR
ncbi:MAG: hypothetical protein M3379_22095 [Acidobacteriota bacterium]|nr:hypothetical protein [Acidobacteriota bacterium]